MKFEHPLNDQFRRSGKLPKITEMEQYMDQFRVVDPYTSSLFTLDNIVSSAKSTKEPTSVNKMWVGSSFHCGTLWPTFVSGTPAIEGNQSVWKDITTSFKKDWERSDVAFRDARSVSITRGKQISYKIENPVKNGFSRYQISQMERFIRELNIKKYLANRNEFDLLRELKTRRKQYPGEQVYILLGEDLSSYMKNMYKSSSWEGAMLLDLDGSYSRSWSWQQHADLDPDRVDTWHSAVFAKPQIRTAHSFSYQYSTERQSRKWRVAWVTFNKFNLEVDELSMEDKVIKPFGLDRFTIE